MRSTEDLVREFALNVAAQTEAIRHTTAREGNRCADRYIRAWKQLRECGDEGREALSVLLRHESADVRSMTAACLLRYRTSESLRVLRKVSGGKGLIAFEASEALERWKETLDKDKWGLDPIE